jgi:hypothetical protein
MSPMGYSGGPGNKATRVQGSGMVIIEVHFEPEAGGSVYFRNIGIMYVTIQKTAM